MYEIDYPWRLDDLYNWDARSELMWAKTYSFPKSYVSYRKLRAIGKEQRERARQMMIEKNKAKEV